jgi:hypothetical protein
MMAHRFIFAPFPAQYKANRNPAANRADVISLLHGMA